VQVKAAFEQGEDLGKAFKSKLLKQQSMKHYAKMGGKVSNRPKKPSAPDP
jgi:hypothetical protein